MLSFSRQQALWAEGPCQTTEFQKEIPLLTKEDGEGAPPRVYHEHGPQLTTLRAPAGAYLLVCSLLAIVAKPGVWHRTAQFSHWFLDLRLPASLPWNPDVL